MTVAELIEKLKLHEPNATVVTDGYEEGFAEDVRVLDVFLKRNGHGAKDGGVYGRHLRPWGNAEKPEKDWDMKAVCVGQGRHLIAGW